MIERNELHKRNKHNGQYNFPVLIEHYPLLKRFILLNPYGIQTINFHNAQAVKALNKALLLSYYVIGIFLKITYALLFQAGLTISIILQI